MKHLSERRVRAKGRQATCASIWVDLYPEIDTQVDQAALEAEVAETVAKSRKKGRRHVEAVKMAVPLAPHILKRPKAADGSQPAKRPKAQGKAREGESA